MTDEQRKVITEMHADGYNDTEIAEKLGISRSRVYRKISYDYYKRKGICTRCCVKKATKGVVCFDCWAELKFFRAKRSEQEQKYRQEHLAHRLEYERMKRVERKENGVCVKCGKRQATEGKTTCTQCRAKINIYQEKYRNQKRKIPIELYRKDGYCSMCGSTDLVEGKKLCHKCYEAACKNAEIARNYIDRKNHFWKKDNALLGRKRT